MAEMQMWRIDAGHRVCDVAVALFTGGMWGCADGHYETTPVAAVRAWAFRNSVMGAVLAPGEPTRAELAAQLAAVTAERDDMRRERDAAASRARSFAGLVRSLGAEVRRVVRERDALRAERDGEHDLIARQAAILTAVADALKGTPPALMTHSHHDLGAVAAATVAQQAPLLDAHDALVAAARAAGWTGAGATGEELVAWVRRGGACKGAEAVRDAAMSVADDLAPDGPEASDEEWAHELMHRVAAAVARVREGGA